MTRQKKLLSPGNSSDSLLPATKVKQLALDLGRMIDLARGHLAQAANAALTTLYWQLGKRVQTEVLASRRAEYGSQIVASLGRQLESRYGRGFGEKNLRRMVQFAETFPDEQIVAALRRQSGCTHFKLLIAVARDFSRFQTERRSTARPTAMCARARSAVCPRTCESWPRTARHLATWSNVQICAMPSR